MNAIIMTAHAIRTQAAENFGGSPGQYSMSIACEMAIEQINNSTNGASRMAIENELKKLEEKMKDLLGDFYYNIPAENFISELKEGKVPYHFPHTEMSGTFEYQDRRPTPEQWRRALKKHIEFDEAMEDCPIGMKAAIDAVMNLAD